MHDLKKFLRDDLIGHGDEIRLLGGANGTIFGGALVAQMLLSAYADVAEGFRCHSLHASFIHAGHPPLPVTFRRKVLRRSRRFTTVSVEAFQNGLVSTAVISFHLPEFSSPEHGVTDRPIEGDPEAAQSALGPPLPALDASIRAPFDLREAGHTTDAQNPQANYWIRCTPDLDAEPRWHEAALAWCSDFSLTKVAGLTHEHLPGKRQAASLDHSIWFHRPANLDNWNHYQVSSPVLQESLALSTGTFRNSAGDLVATVAQESLLRYTYG